MAADGRPLELYRVGALYEGLNEALNHFVANDELSAALGLAAREIYDEARRSLAVAARPSDQPRRFVCAPCRRCAT